MNGSKPWILVGLLAAVAWTGGMASAQDLDSGLEAYWSFDGGSSADESGNGRDAAVRAGAPEWVDGVIGQAVSLSGADSFEVPDWYGLEGGVPRTVACWINTTDTAIHGIVSWGLSSGNGQKYHIRLNENEGNGVVGALRTEIQGTFNVATTAINDGQWHFICSVFPEDGLFVVDVQHYVDGQLEERTGTNANGETIVVDTAASAEVSDQLLRIGSRQQNADEHFFPGLIDEVRIYSRALTADEIMALYDMGSAPASNFPQYMLYR